MEKGLWTAVNDLNKVLDSLAKGDIDLDAKKDVLSFKSNKAELMKRSLGNSYDNLRKLERQIRSYKYDELLGLFDDIERAYAKKDFKEMKSLLNRMLVLIPTEQPIKVDIRLPDAVKSDMSADIQEIKMCYEAGCYRSAVVLCGRLLETALHRKYYEATGNDILETNPAIGLGKLIAKLRDEKVNFPPGITEQIHLINKARISSVHKKSLAFMPSKQQANAIILYTLDVLKNLF